MAYENIIYEKRDRMGIVTMNRPEYLNASSPGMNADIADAFYEMTEDDDILVAIITGTGRAFSAGAFVKDPKVHALDNASEGINRPRRRARGSEDGPAWDFPKPLIGAVNGYAVGGAINHILMACDILIASTEAKFSQNHAKLGIISAWPGGSGLALYVGKAKASEMVLMARTVDAEDAYRWGLVNKVVAPDELMPEAISWAQEIAGLAPLSTRLIKEDLRESFECHYNRAGTRLRGMMAQLTEDRKEGHAAWREKRTPVFKGR